MSDINYPPLDFHEYHGTANAWIEVRVDATRPDKWVISGHPNPAFNGEFDAPDTTHSDTLKVSSCTYLRVTVIGRLRGGVEDCIDINNLSRFIDIIADELESGGKYVCTLKGQSSQLRIYGQIVKHGTEVDADLGNHSDQASGRTEDVYLFLESDIPFTVRVLNADEPYVGTKARWSYIFPSPTKWYHRFCVWFFETFRTVFWK